MKPEVSGLCDQDLELPSISSSPLTFLTSVSPDTSWTDTSAYLGMSFHAAIPPSSLYLALGVLLRITDSCQGRHTTVAPYPQVPFPRSPEQH